MHAEAPGMRRFTLRLNPTAAHLHLSFGKGHECLISYMRKSPKRRSWSQKIMLTIPGINPEMKMDSVLESKEQHFR